MLPGVRKRIFGCWLLNFSYFKTGCIENKFITSRVECSLTVHVTWRFKWNCSLCFIAEENLTAVFSVRCCL